MKFYVTERIGPKRSFTPEGFLLCQDVPIARVGVMDYHESELPLEAEAGVIRVQRLEDEVFKPEAMASFAGKPLVNDHPDDDVTPDNWKLLSIGTVLNPRRGTGELSDVMLADLLITDKEGIKLVQEDEKVEVSCGYEAEYEQIKPGLARQYSIVGNHLALVEKGRCGPRCSIGDQAMSITLMEGQMAKLTVKKPVSFKDRLIAAFRAKDESAIEKLAGEVTEDDGEIAESDLKSGAGGITINVNGAGGSTSTSGDTKTGDENEPEKKDDPMKPVMDAIAALGERIGKLESGSSSTGDADEEEDDDTATNDSDEEEEGGKDKTKDTGAKTRDSAGLKAVFDDTVARAEILVPGIKMPTFDAKAPHKTTSDALCKFRRKALDKAFASDEGKAAIEPLLAGAKTLDTKSMTCDGARVMFIAASEAMKNQNRDQARGTGAIRTDDTGTKKAVTIDSLNEQNRKFWNKKS
jgi:hypothetical protein